MLSCNIRKALRDFELNMDFTVGHETLVIIGHSGCGKSATLKLIAGLMLPDEGRIAVGGREFFEKSENVNVPPEERHTGFVFQNYALFPHLTVFENIAYGLGSRKISRQEKKAKVETMLRMLDIPHLSDRMPADLSGGEQQRVALARALVLAPDVLLLDEPLSALDVTTRGRVRRELKKTLSAVEIPKVVVTHDYEDAISLGDRILVMDHGRAIQEGTAQQLLTCPRSAFVADFSGTNFYSGQVLGIENGLTRLRVADGGAVLRSAEFGEGALSVMIYPWDIELTREKPEDKYGTVLQGEVVNILSYGNRGRVEIEGALPLTVEMTDGALKQLDLKERESVYAVIDPDAVRVLKNGAGTYNGQ